MAIVCKKASQKLNALSRLCALISFDKRKMLMNAFFNSQFSYSPLVWMFHNRQINTKINNLHYRALRIIYLDESSSFEELLRRGGTVTVHRRNLQFLLTEMSKVFNGMVPPFMQDVFKRHGNAFAEIVSSNTRSKLNFYNPSNPRTVKYGLETLTTLGPKLWEMIPVGIRNSISHSVFKTKIKTWVPRSCPCRLCKVYVPRLGFLWFLNLGWRVVTGGGGYVQGSGGGRVGCWVRVGRWYFYFCTTSSAFYLYFYFCFYFSFTSTYISYYFIHFFTFIYLVAYILRTFFLAVYILKIFNSM